MTLTKQDIEQMEPSREMDALIGEHIFGMIWKTFSGVSILVHPDSPFGNESWWKLGKFGIPAYDDNLLGSYIYQYSTSLYRAWEVLEKFDWWHITKPSARIFVELKGGYVGIGENTPLAICRAALLSVLDKINEINEEKTS